MKNLLFAKTGSICAGTVMLLCSCASPTDNTTASPVVVSTEQPSTNAALAPDNKESLPHLRSAEGKDSLPPYNSAEYDGMAPDIAAILQRGELIVAMPSADTPLFHETDENSETTGIDADLARSIAADLGVDVHFDRSSRTFVDLTDKLKHGEVDLVISTYSMTTERNMYIDFSDPYLETYLSVLVSKQALVTNKIESSPLDYMKTNPVTIGAVAGTAHYDMAKSLFPDAVITPLAGYEEGYEKVISGELFAFLSGELEFLSAFEQDPVLGLYASVYSFTDLRDQFCIGVSRDTPQLLDYVNTYLRTRNRLTYDQVAQAYKERYGE